MLTNYDSTLFRVRADFFANRHEVAFKAQDVATTLQKLVISRFQGRHFLQTP